MATDSCGSKQEIKTLPLQQASVQLKVVYSSPQLLSFVDKQLLEHLLTSQRQQDLPDFCASPMPAPEKLSPNIIKTRYTISYEMT